MTTVLERLTESKAEASALVKLQRSVVFNEPEFYSLQELVVVRRVWRESIPHITNGQAA